MASSYCPQWKYDVFLSFRGEDTRKTFTSHLYEGLRNRGIFTFQDDKRLEHGDSISEELSKAIEESQGALIVFSKNYATSRWCLNELMKIMECKDKNGQIVIPVFYDVDPAHVRKQTESFAKAFAEHELKYKDDDEGMQKVQVWRTALTAAANLKGFDIRDGIESEKIQQIVDHISSKLCKSAYSLSYLQDVVGINAHLEKLKSLLQIEINDVRIVGIWGIGGIGKTTIAKAIFDTLSYQFEAACFLADVKENARKNQLHSVQNTLLSELLRKKDHYVENKYDGKCMIPRRLRFMKVLIVLDDIDHGDHLEYLAGDLGWFGNGSRVIVTTRNRHLIEKDGAIPYEMSTLPDDEAMQLFNQHAFKKEVPDERFKDFSWEVVNHAHGLPLAIKVWGSLLHKKNLSHWGRTLDQIKKNCNSEIVENLKISYDGLEREEQDIFLDIACCFRGDRKEDVMKILESCDFEAEYGLDVLIDKSLVFITKDNTIEMHDLIQDMGKYIVKIQKDPSKRSRLWDVEDFKELMVDSVGTKAMEAIKFAYDEQICFNKEAMQTMKKLRILSLWNWQYNFSSSPSLIDSEDIPSGSIEYLSNNLRWVDWNLYPWVSLPENFKPQKLVHLNLQRSLLHDLWTKRKHHLPYLRELNLSYSERLMQLPDFMGMPNLKYLNLRECTSLEELPSSICELRFLVVLNVSGCSQLESLPEEIGNLQNLKELRANYTLISRPSSSIIHLNKLELLSFGKLKSEDGVYFVFPQVNEGLLSLKYLDLCSCNLIDGGLPEDIGSLSSLETLILSGNNFEHLPRSIAELGALRSLYLSDCNRLKQLPQFPQQLNTIIADWSNDWICNSLFQNISTLQHDFSASDSLSLRVFMSWGGNIPSWFRSFGPRTFLIVNLPENWYELDNFLGLAVCCSGKLFDIIAHLTDSFDDGMLSMTQKFALSNHSVYSEEFDIHFFLVPLVGLRDTSKANGKTPNDYRFIKLCFSGEMKCGFRLLYKDDPQLCIGIKRSSYDHEEASCSYSKKQRSQVEASVSSKRTLQLFPTSPEF